MKTSFKILYPDGRVIPGEVDWPKEPGYERIAALVEPLLGQGRHLEHVSILRPDHRRDEKLRPYSARDMFVDELGALDGLPLNPTATKLYQALTVYRTGSAGDCQGIFGLAVVFDKRVWF